MRYTVSEKLEIIRFVNHPPWFLTLHHRLDAATIMKVEDVTDMLRLEARPITASVNDVSLHFATCGAAWSAVAGAARIDQAEAALMSLIPDT